MRKTKLEKCIETIYEDGDLFISPGEIAASIPLDERRERFINWFANHKRNDLQQAVV